MSKADRINKLLGTLDADPKDVTKSAEEAMRADSKVARPTGRKKQVAIYMPVDTEIFKEIDMFVAKSSENLKPGTMPISFTRLLRDFLVQYDEEIAPMLKKHLRSL